VGLTNFFSFTIAQSNSAALFEVYNLTGNGDLTLQRSNLPYFPPYFASSVNPGSNYEQIVIRTNGLLPDINGIWYLTVPNNETNLITYTIRAVVATNGMLISGLPLNIGITIPGGTNVHLTFPTVDGEHYQILATTNIAMPFLTWPVLTTITASGPTTIFIDPTPVSGFPARVYGVNQVP